VLAGAYLGFGSLCRESGLTVFTRDSTTGGLHLAGCVSYAAYYDDEVTNACQLGRGVAGATGVITAPDGHNVYLTASGSDSVATFATGARPRSSPT
jgi:hypothetical protein